MMLMAIPNGALGIDGGEEDEDAPRPCGSRSKEDPTLRCVSPVGHAGRHTYRPAEGSVGPLN
jgi:hypothetical protein